MCEISIKYLLLNLRLESVSQRHTLFVIMNLLNMKTLEIVIEGYCPLHKCNELPECSGIYFVYTGFYNPLTKRLNIGDLIYIGESGNIRERICSHEKMDEWKSYLVNSFTTLYFSISPLSEEDRKRAEAAYIYHHKPIVNTEYKENFPFQMTRIISEGDIINLDPDFTVGK